MRFLWKLCPHPPGIALRPRTSSLTAASRFAVVLRQGGVLGWKMSLLTAAEENVTCECNPGSVAAAHALSLLSMRLSSRFTKTLSIAGLSILALSVVAGGGVGTFLSQVHC